MDTATLTWGLLAGVIAIAVAGGLWWRGQRLRRAEAARQAARAIVQAQQEAQRKAAEAQTAERLRAEQAVRAQAEREAQQRARAEAERAAAAEAARRAAAQVNAEARANAEAAAEQAAAETAQLAERQAASLAAQHEAQRSAAAQAAATPRSPADTLVLVADDSKVVRVKTSRLLAQHGYRVVLAEDGVQAAQLIEAELPAVLVTDVEMPGLDGFALTRHVRAHPLASRIPIIMITSADDRLKAAAAEAGVTLVLGKPYPEDELIACIERSQAAITSAA